MSGCADPAGPQPVSGTVRLEGGEPLSYGFILFKPDAGPTARGVVDEAGRFELTTEKPGDGALPGIYRVAIIPERAEGYDPDSRSNVEPPPPRIDPKYSRPETSGVTVEVEPGGTDRCDLTVSAPSS